MKKSPWPMALTGFFVLLVAVMIVFVVWSLRQRVDLVAPDYYAQEIQHQQRINASVRAKNEGLKPAISYDRGRSQLSLQFPDDAALQSATGTVTLYRPSDASLDRTYSFQPGEGGAQIISVELVPGLWRVKMDWRRDEASYFVEDAIMVR